MVAAPAEVIEAILANLVLNAIQHGAPGTIAIDVDAQKLQIANAVHQGDSTPGFGLGLEVVERLTRRVGGGITTLGHDGFHFTPQPSTSRKARACDQPHWMRSVLS